MTFVYTLIIVAAIWGALWFSTGRKGPTSSGKIGGGSPGGDNSDPSNPAQS